jgi:uncharacterized repeat protein (TIGR03837 family)
MQWSVFCRVVDNFGDIGFAWRLAADLAGRGERVRLAVDDASALAWMAPKGARGVEIVAWSDGAAPTSDVLVECFGGGLPEAIEAQFAGSAQMPVRVNVEHLSAEPFVARSHGLPSPRFTARGDPWPTWFFFPGFDARTGGLLREPGLLGRRDDFGRGDAFLASLGLVPVPGERRVSLFCYRQAPIAALVDALADAPTLLLLTPGPAADGVLAVLGAERRRGRLRAAALPALAQADFDRLLWSCDLNVVRGEDSLVRAVWAGVPFLWQAYRQDDGAQSAKVAALLDRLLADAPSATASFVRRAFVAWNALEGTADDLAPALRSVPAWTESLRRWRDGLARQSDLTSALLEFVASKR